MVFTYAMIEEALGFHTASEQQEATDPDTDLNEGLATVSTMSQPTEGAVNAVISTVSIGTQVIAPVLYWHSHSLSYSR